MQGTSVRDRARRFGKVVARAAPYVRAGQWAVRTYSGVKRAASGALRNTPAKRQKIDRVTTQKDYANISTKGNRRRARKAKKWKRYVKRVNKAVAAFGPSRKIVKTFQTGTAITALNLDEQREGAAVPWGRIGRQDVLHLPMFQYATANTSQEADDINEMIATITSSEANTTDQTVTLPVYVKSGLWEFIISNFDTNACYVDLYHYTVKRTGIYNFNDLIFATDAQVAAGAVPAGGTGYITTPGITDYGWTPYQSRTLMQYIDIFKKERYLMSSGQNIQIERRMKVNKMWRKEQSAAGGANVENKMAKGISQGVIVIVYGAPLNVANQRITGPCRINISVNKSLFFQRGSAQPQVADVENRTYQ